MEKGSTSSKQTKRYSWIIGLFIFITALLLGCIIVKNIELSLIHISEPTRP